MVWPLKSGKHIKSSPEQSNKRNFGFSTHCVQNANPVNKNNKANTLVAMANCDLQTVLYIFLHKTFLHFSCTVLYL